MRQYEQLTQKTLHQNYEDWTIIDPLVFGRTLNRLLRTEEIRRAYHQVTVAYEAIRRWEILESTSFSRYPSSLKPLEGEQYLYPSQMESMD